MHIEWTMRKTGTILGSEIRGMRRRTRDDRVKQRISGKEMEKEKKKEKRRTDSKKETIKYEERERERRRTPFLPSMPLLDHVKYANCGYAEALLVLVLPSTNYISFGRMCVARAMGTHRIPRVYAPCPKTVHTVKYTRAPTFLSRSWTSSFPPSTPDPPPFVALVAILPRLTRDARPNLSPRIYTRVEWHAIGNFCPPFLFFSLLRSENSGIGLAIGRPKNPSRPISPIHRAPLRVPRSTRLFRCPKFPGFPSMDNYSIERISDSIERKTVAIGLRGRGGGAGREEKS